VTARLIGLADRVSREPVLVGAAVQAQLLASFPNWSPAARLAVGAWIALFQRGFSTSKKTADENVDTAKAEVATKVEEAKYVGAVEHQALALAARVPNRPLRAKAA